MKTESKKLLSAGYHLILKSWENDGDLPQRIEITSDCLSDLISIIKFCRKFAGRGDTHRPGNIANTCDGLRENDVEEIIEYMKADKYLSTKISDASDYLENPEDCEDFITELFGTYLGFSEFYTVRVFEDYELFHITEDFFVDYITDVEL